jgi:hypothetical protein
MLPSGHDHHLRHADLAETPPARQWSCTIGNFRRTPLRCPFGPTSTNIDLIPKPYAQTGERDPDCLCEAVLTALRTTGLG